MTVGNVVHKDDVYLLLTPDRITPLTGRQCTAFSRVCARCAPPSCMNACVHYAKNITSRNNRERMRTVDSVPWVWESLTDACGWLELAATAVCNCCSRRAGNLCIGESYVVMVPRCDGPLVSLLLQAVVECFAMFSPSSVFVDKKF